MGARSSMSALHTMRSGAAALCLAAGLATSAQAQWHDPSQPSPTLKLSEWVTVPYENFELEFLTEDLDAHTVWAYSSGDRGTTPYKLMDTVVVKTTDLNALRLAVASIDAEALAPGERPSIASAIQGAEHFMAVKCHSVRRAVVLLKALRQWDDLDEAFLDMDVPKTSNGGGGAPNDPFFPAQWYIDNTVFTVQDASILEAWTMATGEGVVVGLLDRGEFNFDSPYFNDSITALGFLHQDIDANYNAELSQETEVNPFPTLAANPQFQHSLAMAGIVAAEANNSLGIAGVAYNAQLAALRNGGLLQTGYALAHNNDSIDIKLHTWGFAQAGEVGFPFNRSGQGTIAYDFLLDTLLNSVNNGRGGLGNVHVVAAGNGGNFYNSDPDSWYVDYEGRTDYDLFASSRFTIAVGAAAETAAFAATLPDYASVGASVLIAAPAAATSGIGRGFDVPSVNSATLVEGFTTPNAFGTAVDGGILALPYPEAPVADTSNTYEGTSVSAAITAGVVALMLEVNPNLTWRDVQYILVETANPFAVGFVGLRSYPNPGALPSRFDDPDGARSERSLWQINGGGRAVSDGFGFGMIDAEAAVAAAMTWENVPDPFVLTTNVLNLGIEVPEPANQLDPDADPEELIAVIEAPAAVSPEICVRNNVSVEHVELEITIDGGPATGLEIWLVSPSGTISLFKKGITSAGNPRTQPALIAGADTAGEFRFTSVKHWGEPAAGPWQVFVQDELSEPCCELGCGEDGVWCDAAYTVTSLRLRLFGIDTGRVNFPCPFTRLVCGGDLTGDGYVTIDDLLLFLDLWNAGDLEADANEDGEVNYADFLFFYTQIWFPQLGGCANVVDFNGIPLGNGRGRPIGPGGFDG